MKHALALALAVAAAPAAASTVRELSPGQLAAGADCVVEASVVARTVTWNPAHTGFETHATLAVTATLLGANEPLVEVVVPGGEMGDARHVVIGMPAITLGERARWFLAMRGDGTFRVYGWAQGKWPAQMIAGIETFAPAPLAAERAGGLAEFTTNGMVWPAAKIPVQYYINMTGSDDLTLPQVTTAVDAAFATWQAVPCSSLAFQDAGGTTLGEAIDGTNVILFTETGWAYGAEAAAATSIYIIPGMQTADINVNGQDWTWAVAPPGSAIDANTLDLQAVLTHETGHFSGLNHTMRAYDTMYYSWKPWQDQRHLSVDDKQGLCSIYPKMGNECPPACTWPGETCQTYSLGALCTGQPDPVGAPCNYDHVACDGFCLFTALNLSSGYCSKFCTSNADCPLTHHCALPTSGTTMMVCLLGPQPIQNPCKVDTDCPTGQYCNGTSCTFDCRTAADCGANMTCDDRGQCAAVSAGGGGCQSTPSPGWFALALIALATRRRGSRAASPGS
jgi:hypothetical protein